MIYCPGCGTANRDGSRFCNECGTKLPTMTSSLCPACGTPNPPHSLFCEKCGARLIASLAEEPGEPESSVPAAFVPKGLSLPTKSSAEGEPAVAEPIPVEPQPPAEQAKPADEELPEWMQVVQSAVAGTSELDIAKVTAASSTADEAAPEEIPSWLSDLGLKESGPLKKSPTDELLPEWAQRLRTIPESAEPSSAEEEIPDWLKTLGTTGQLPATFETPAAAPEVTSPPTAHVAPSEPSAAEEELPEWLKEPATPYFSTEPEAPPVPSAAPVQPSEEMPDWLRDLRPTAPAEDALPDWLDELGMEEQPASGSMALSTGDSALDWLSQLGATAPETPLEPETAPAPDWMSSLRASAPDVDAQPTEEAPDWLRELEKEQPPLEPVGDSKTPDWMSSLAATSTESEIPAEEEGVPEWLKGAGLAAAGAAAVGAHVDGEQPEEPAPQKPVTDWLSALRQATPEIEAEQAQAEEEIPAWMRDESGAAPQAIGGVQSYDQEIPDWLREAGAGVQQPIPSAEEQLPEWLRETQAPLDSGEAQQPAQAEEEGVPEWLKGAGLAVAGAAAVSAFADEEQPEEPVPQKPATDWLSALRQATPEIEAEQAQAEEEVPAWLREETGAAPQAIGGVQSYDQEVPDWLRETGAGAAPSAQIEEEGVPDWLREESGVAFAPAQPAATAEAEEEEGVPDWLKGLGAVTAGAAAVAAAAPRAEEPAEEGLPDWLREEPTPAAQPELGEVPEWLREAEPAPPITFETPEEELAPGETPDWLRDLAPAAAVAAAVPEVEEPEEIEQPEVAAEVEPEEESWMSKAAPVAAAGLAAAAVVGAAKKPEQAEAAAVEMPDWLKEIRQEQQVARASIPVPPPEAAGLTQAEIPAWLEALRPSREAAAPQEAETPSETEGPLAGIANALPPAPIMGEMMGLPAKLQFAISAEDQARAGVLKELLTQHAVAPASVEQFIVKGSTVRRRALRWLVAFLIIAVLFVPFGFDINQLTGFPLLPTATKMMVPDANMSAAVQIAQVAQLPNSKVLIVFDYDASQFGEMNRVALALLKSPALRSAQLEIASLNPQGSAMAQAVLQDKDLAELNLHYTLRGFKPGQVNGVQSILADVGSVNLIIDLAASPETVRWWAEQLKANRDDTPLVVGVSAGAEPLTMPYVQSGQVQGLVSGFPGAVAYLNAAQQMNTYDTDQIKDYQIPLDALTLANYVLVILIVVGLIAALLRGAGRRSA